MGRKRRKKTRGNDDTRPTTAAHSASTRRCLVPDFDLRSVGLFRVLLGLTLIYDLLFRKFPYVADFYSDQGVIPSGFVRNLYGSLSKSPFDLLGSDAAVYVFFSLTLVAYTLFTLGYRARIAGLIGYICLWSIHQRNPFIIYGFDMILNASLFWALFLPLEARFRLLPGGATREYRMRRLAVVGMLLQISFIYLIAGMSKYGDTWWNGTAISLAVTDTLNTTAASAWLGSHPALCTALTYATLVFEFVLIFLLFSPWRSTLVRAIGGGLILVFNWGLAPFLVLGPFYLMATVHFALLIPSSWWDRFRGAGDSADSEIERRPEWRSRLGDAVLAVCIAGLIWSNIYPLTRAGPLSQPLQRWSVVRGLWPATYPLWEYSSILRQDWSLFSPDPSWEAGWIVVAGESVDGTYRDLLTGNPLSWTFTPDGVQGDYRDLHGTEQPPAEPRPPDTKLRRGVWKDFADYMRRLYETPEWGAIGDSWMAFEARAWDRRHPESPLRRVDVMLVSINGYDVLETGVRKPGLYWLRQLEIPGP